MQRLFIVLTFLGLGFIGLAGCSSDTSSSGDCRNGEPICIDRYSSISRFGMCSIFALWNWSRGGCMCDYHVQQRSPGCTRAVPKALYWSQCFAHLGGSGFLLVACRMVLLPDVDVDVCKSKVLR